MVGRCAGAGRCRLRRLCPVPPTAAAPDLTRGGGRASRCGAGRSGGAGQPRAAGGAGRRRAGERARDDAAAARRERRGGARARRRAVAASRTVRLAVRAGADPAFRGRGRQPGGGDEPRPHLLFLAPEASFQTVTRNGRLYVDPRSYARYDAAADVIASLDPRAAVDLYRQVQPLCEEAYRELGHPPGRFDDVVAKAIQTLLATPVVDGEIELRPKVVTYAFADRRLEALSPAQRHLLRMGPRNVRLIQGELRDLAAALGVPESEPRQ